MSWKWNRACQSSAGVYCLVSGCACVSMQSARYVSTFLCQHIGTYLRHRAVMVMSCQHISCHDSHTGVSTSAHTFVIKLSWSCHVSALAVMVRIPVSVHRAYLRHQAAMCHLCQRFGTCGCRHNSGSWHTGHTWHLAGISLQNSPL